MGIWPFRRKSNRRRKPSAPTSIEESNMANQRDDGRMEKGILGLGRKKDGTVQDKPRLGRAPSKKLQRKSDNRTYSFSPGRNDTIRVPKDIHRTHPVPPVPSNAADMAAMTQNDQQSWTRVPTLHKRSAQDLSRRKSSKKRKEEHQREAEIKAMSSTMPPVPPRSATDIGSFGSRQKVEKQLSRRSLKKDYTNPAPQIPHDVAESAESISSSEATKSASYELKGMDLFAPRPTIRYSRNPRTDAVVDAVSLDTPPRKEKERETIPEVRPENRNGRKRIDELADDLDAGSLRELMERDQRRRERKRREEEERTQRRLARKVAKQRAAEAEAEASGTSPPQNMDRGIMGREVVGLGIEGETSPESNQPDTTPRAPEVNRPDETSPADGSHQAQESTQSTEEITLQQYLEGAESQAQLTEPLQKLQPSETASRPATAGRQYVGEFQRSESLPATEPGSPVDENEDLEIGTARVARLSKASMSPPSSPKGHARGASNISEMMELPKVDTPTDTVRAERRASDDGSRQYLSWKSIFKRSGKEKRNSIPTSFSNTSRDSTSTPPTPPHALAPRQSASSVVPKRTMSRFKEDLPETHMLPSPPPSRVQSPEVDTLPPIKTAHLEKRVGHRGSVEHASTDSSLRRHDTPTSGWRSLEQPSRVRTETPTSAHRSIGPSPEPSAIMSQSLASIDSEGSWLSGRPRAGSKRSSAQQAHPGHRDSESSLQKRYKEYSGSAEELGIAEDEYFSRLSPEPEDFAARSRRRASGEPMPSSDEEDGDNALNPVPSTKWGAVAKRPTVIHRQPRAPKSREGLLNDYENDSLSEHPGGTPQELTDRDSFGVESPDSPSAADAGIERASSVNLKSKHARHISAGSARLLDIKPRASGDARRGSIDPPAHPGQSTAA
jgi:hypothetical protein